MTKLTIASIVFTLLFTLAWFLYLLFSDHCHGGNIKIQNALKSSKLLSMVEQSMDITDEMMCPVVRKIHSTLGVESSQRIP